MGGAGGGGEKLTDEQKGECDALKFTADLNLAACYLKEEKWEKAVARATKVLDNDPENTKALFRRGHGRIYINDLERARVRTKPPRPPLLAQHPARSWLPVRLFLAHPKRSLLDLPA